MADNIKLQSFLDAVYRSAEEKSRSMIREIDEASENAYKAFCQKAEAQTDLKINREISRIEISAAAELSKEEREIRSAIFKRRCEITEEVFSEVRKKLSKYRQTDDYEKKLISDAEKLKALFESDSAVIYIGEQDKDKLEAIKAVLGDIKAEISKDIKLGGILGICGDMIYDCTLDSRLDKVKTEFIEKSGLQVV